MTDKAKKYERPRRDGFAIVLIEWRIKPNQEAVSAFMEYWTKVAGIEDTAGLVGEFLSAPVPADELSLPVKVDDLGAGDSNSKAWRFINVGLWKDIQTFYEQVGKHMTDKKQSFEVKRRRRIILEPQEWRRGGWELPPATCE